MRPVYLLDDGRGDLAPLTALRASFEVRIGPLTHLERLLSPEWRPEGLMLWGLFAPEGMAALCRERSGLPVNELRSGGVEVPVAVVNGRWAVPDWARVAGLRSGEALVEGESGDLMAACVPEATVPRVVRGEWGGLRAVRIDGRSLLSRPWHVRTFRDAAVKQGMEVFRVMEEIRPGLAPAGVAVVGSHGARMAADAKVYPGVVMDSEGGPVVLGAGATVRPGAVLVGPVYVGPGSTVLDRAVIRPNTVIGQQCKVAGEVSGTTFQGLANKAHDGFLGDSWVGEWANLGAGTTGSNLLNTYGEVIARATPEGPNERTGEQFLGAIIGDHVKTAICTRLMTGAVIHTGAMVARTAAVSGCVAPFAWMTDEGDRRYRLEKFVEVTRAAMGRRGVSPSGAYVERLRVVHGEAAGG